MMKLSSLLLLALSLLYSACGGSAANASASANTNGDTSTSGGENPDGGGSGLITNDESGAPWRSGTVDGTESVSEMGEALPERKAMNSGAASAFTRGLGEMQNGNDSAAAASFSSALEKDSGAYQAAYLLGVRSDRNGDSNRAMSYYMQALRIQPDYELAAQGVMAIYLRRGDNSAAIAFAQPLATKYKRNLRLQAVYGNGLVYANRLDEAEVVAREALRKDERYVPAMLVLVRSSINRGRTELAESILDQALSIAPNNAEALF
ncbi:MAG: tetratricopeptide repeat protein [Myxococcales bacterium]|nr:MAG: tetratricopeptide repeat protein [Myxococcales bacterium]